MVVASAYPLGAGLCSLRAAGFRLEMAQLISSVDKSIFERARPGIRRQCRAACFLAHGCRTMTRC